MKLDYRLVNSALAVIVVLGCWSINSSDSQVTRMNRKKTLNLVYERNFKKTRVEQLGPPSEEGQSAASIESRFNSPTEKRTIHNDLL